jgi:hypothetical protein
MYPPYQARVGLRWNGQSRRTMLVRVLLLMLLSAAAHAATPYDFGAVGKGVDDTAALQAWLTAGSHGAPLGCSGTFLFSNTLMLPSAPWS